MRTSENMIAMQEALAAAQAELPIVAPLLENPYYDSRYADFTALKKACDPVLNKHGLSVIHGSTVDAGIQVVDVEFTDKDGQMQKAAKIFSQLKVTARLSHTSGCWIETDFSTPVPDPNPQKMGAALTYCKRYTYAAIIGAAVGEQDDDGNEASDATPRNTDLTESSEELDDILKGL